MSLKPPTRNQASWANMISAVQSPLGLFALVVLVIEAILSFLAFRATGANLTILSVGMIAAFLLLIVSVVYLGRTSPQLLLGGHKKLQPGTRIKYDVFLSAPMAAFEDEEEYRRSREDVIRIIDVLRQKCKFSSVIFAGRDIESMSDFDAGDISIQEDYEALSECEHFVMLYPRKIASSVLVEAGWALALGKISIYFVRDRDDLPFLLRQAESVFPAVKIYEDADADEIIRLINRHGEQVFAVPRREHEQVNE